MVLQCSYPNCKNKSYKWAKQSFHHFPVYDKERTKLWLEAAGLDLNIPIEILRKQSLCSDHFRPEDFRDTLIRPFLTTSAVPSVYRGSTTASVKLQEHEGPKVEEISRKQLLAWESTVETPSMSSNSVSQLSSAHSSQVDKGQSSNEMLQSTPDFAPSLNLGQPESTSTMGSLQNRLKRSKLQKAKKRQMAIARFFIQSQCCVTNCGGRSHNDRGQRIRNGLTFFQFPVWKKDQGGFMSSLSRRQRQAWVDAVGRDDLFFDDIPDEARVCSKHFVSGKPAYEMNEEDPDWTPSLHLHNESPQVVRNQTAIRTKRKSSTPTPSETDGTPSALQWKNPESGLLRLVEDKKLPTETPPVQDFKLFFQNALRASLDACLASDSQSTSAPGLLIDQSWFSHIKKSSLPSDGGPVSSCDSPVSAASCQNCVRLQERIAELEQRLTGPQFIQGHTSFSKWTQPLSQIELQSDQPT